MPASVLQSACRIEPKVPGADNAVVREEVVFSLDIVPALLDAAAPGQGHDHKGRSLLSLTHGPQQFYLRYAVSGERYKWIFNVLGGERENPLTPESYLNAWWGSQKPGYLQSPIRDVCDHVEHPPHIEFYDLQQHPYEWSNLADKPECADVRDPLMQAIGDWRESTQYPLLDQAEFKKEESKVNGSS
jgi:hypothetical protein